MGVDCPDVLLLALVIYLTAVLFLSEESSNVITFIRIIENGKQKTLFGKFVSMLVLIVSARLFRTVFELLTLISRGNFQELAYPVRTIEFLKLFAEIPLSHLLSLVIITAVFILVSLAVVYRYYVGNCGKFVLKSASVAAAFVICALSSGCARKPSDNVIYNYRDGFFFAQNDEYYFVESDVVNFAVISDNGKFAIRNGVGVSKVLEFPDFVS